MRGVVEPYCRGRYRDSWHLNEVCISIRSQPRHRCRAVGQDGDILDMRVTHCRTREQPSDFFRKLLKRQEGIAFAVGQRQALKRYSRPSRGLACALPIESGGATTPGPSFPLL